MLKVQTIRGEVLEKSVAVEAGISGILGYILDIDTEKSKSFGSSNQSLNFNSKINLLTDLKFVPNVISRKFMHFAAVRNKFAHVQKVDSFTKCYELLTEEKKYLLKNYGSSFPDDTCEETKLSVCFDFLCMELKFWMDLMLKKTHYEKSENLVKINLIELVRFQIKQKGEINRFTLKEIKRLLKKINLPNFII